MAPEPICPECVSDKHQNCLGIAWDEQLDIEVRCSCYDRTHQLFF